MKFNNAKRKLLVLAGAATLPWALGLPAQGHVESVSKLEV